MSEAARSAIRPRTSLPWTGSALPGTASTPAGRGPPTAAWHAAAVNVGVRPMFESGLGELVEAHLLDFSGDLYDQPLRVQFLKRLRGERRFDGVDSLIDQIGRDVDEARAVAAAAA